MFGHVYRCDRCPFDFSSGWSHHVGGQLLCCPQCGGDFTLGKGQKAWEPVSGEMLELIQRTDQGRVPTGITREIQPSSKDLDDESAGFYHLEFEPIVCPACDANTVLVQELAEGMPCPSCQAGIISTDGSCIY